MEKSNKLITQGFEIAGLEGYYQYLITFLLLLFGVTTNICHAGLFLMETSPLVEIVKNGTNSTVITTLSYRICDSNTNYRIMEHMSKHTWVYDFNIYCDKFKVSLIGFFYCFGCILGSYTLQVVQTRRGPKDSAIFFLSLFSLFSILLCSAGESLILLYISILGLGFSAIPIFILKVNLITEISSNNIRSFLNNIILSSGNITLMIIYFLYDNDVHWRTMYFFNALIIIILIAVFSIFSVESPRFLIMNNKELDFMISILKIYETNNTKENGSSMEKIISFIDNFKEHDNLKEVLTKHFGTRYISAISLTECEKNNKVRIDEKEKNLMTNDSECSSLTETQDISVFNENDNNSLFESDMRKAPNLKLSENSIIEIIKEPLEKCKQVNLINTIINTPEDKKESTIMISEIIVNDKISLKWNFIISLGLINYLAFVYNISMKNYSYVFNNKVYFVSLLSMFSSIPISYLMNRLGRRGTKISLIILFMLGVYLSNVQNNFDISLVVFIFLTNKIMIHFISIVHLTHLNESFTTKTRLIVSSWAFIFGKICSMIAPFVIEYFSKSLYKIILSISLVTFIFILNQKETHGKELKE